MNMSNLKRDCRWDRVVRSCVRGSVLIALLAGCSIHDLVKSADLPSDIRDPGVVKTEAGARGAYASALSRFRDEIGSYVYWSGMLTDELLAVTGSGFGSADCNLQSSSIGACATDLRNISEEVYNQNAPFSHLQKIRGLAREARGTLRKYYPSAPAALQGHMFAIEGMVDVLLAELFCSGIPLSTVDYEANYTLTPGRSSEEVYTEALALFDSAALYAVDSARILQFAYVGRARALLGLGRIADAAAAVERVDDHYQYVFNYSTSNPKWIPTPDGVVIGNGEGGNGLPFRSYTDPRTTLPAINSKTAPFVVASGVEARLIEAEAALAAGRPTDWLRLLNALRTSCVLADECPDPAPPGIGGVSGLPPLEDPALEPLPPNKDTTDVRDDLLFAERAYWLFLTGHRQGDLRRLVRQYLRPQETVYPVGAWAGGPANTYGTDVNLPVPKEERLRNPLYRGCIDRDA